MNRPLITVITVSYNAISTIEATILSVINQTYTNIEYIIIDGGSTDGTLDIIKKYEENIHYWISEPDKGIYDAMNKGIQKASGKWINFMNSGDSFFSNTTIEEVFNLAKSSSDIIYGDTNIILDIGEYIKKGNIITAHNYMPFVHQSSFTRTTLMKEYGFDTKFKICADRNFFYNIYKRNAKFQYIDKVIANYEAIMGFSSVNTTNLMYEMGIIEGVNHNILWRIKLLLFNILNNIKKILKRILPTTLSTYLRVKRADKYFNH